MKSEEVGHECVIWFQVVLQKCHLPGPKIQGLAGEP